MNTDKFKNIELKYMELKAKLEKGEITSDQMKQQLKKLMILDEKGHYWMIGGKSGKWYTYDGTEWKEDDPFKAESVSQQDTSQTRFYPQQEIDLPGTHRWFVGQVVAAHIAEGYSREWPLMYWPREYRKVGELLLRQE